MTAQQYTTALRVSTEAAMKGGLSLPEIIGMLELAKINVERMAYQHAMNQVDHNNIVRVATMPPPGAPN